MVLILSYDDLAKLKRQRNFIRKKKKFVMGPSTMEFDVSSLICIQALSVSLDRN